LSVPAEDFPTAGVGEPMRGELRRLRQLPPLVVALVVAHLLMKLALAHRALEAPLQGDEVAYADGAKAMSNLVREVLSFGAVDATSSVRETVINNGWFMPGMSLVMTPLYVFFPHAGPELLRVYIGFLTTVLLFATASVLRRDVGRVYGLALLVFPGLLPMWVLYSFTVWGDLCAGLTAILLVALLVRLARNLVEGVTPSIGLGAAIGSLGIATLYLRSSALPLVAGTLVLGLVGVLTLARGPVRSRGLASWLVAVAVFLALLLPWSVSASRALGGRVVTTTSVPTSVAVAFGDQQRLCFGPCDPGNIWVNMVRYSRQVGRATGTSELVVQKQMSSYALRGVTARSYAIDVRGDLGRYVLQPSGFEGIFRAVPGSPPGFTSRVISWTTNVFYFLAFAFSVLGIATVARRGPVTQTLGLLLKLAGAALMVQPFLHVCTPRYWPVLAPLMGALSVFAITTLRERHRNPGRGRAASPATAAESWLTRLQVAAAIGWALVLALVLGLSV
jgi:hypothetical protein